MKSSVTTTIIRQSNGSTNKSSVLELSIRHLVFQCTKCDIEEEVIGTWSKPTCGQCGEKAEVIKEIPYEKLYEV